MKVLNLFDYQTKFKDDIKAAFGNGNKRVVGIMPTGAGKTTCFTSMVQGALALGHEIMIEVPGGEIGDQICERFDDYGIPYGVMISGYKPNLDAPIQITTAITGRKYVETTKRIFTLKVTDECHRLVAKTSQELQHVLFENGLEYDLGVTATGITMDGRGLGCSYDAIVQGVQIPYLIKIGRLAQPTVWSPDLKYALPSMSGGEQLGAQAKILNDKISIKSAVAYYLLKTNGGNQSIWFCPTIETCHQVASALNANGRNAQVIDGTMSREKRRELVYLFRIGAVTELMSSELLLVGFDAPGVESVVWYRRTGSPRVWDQGNGRGYRTHPGGPIEDKYGNVVRIAEKKTTFDIFDLVGNQHNHNRVDGERFYTLEGTQRRRKEVSEIKQCLGCHRWCERVHQNCPYPDCGKSFIQARSARRGPRYRDLNPDEMVEVTEEVTKELTKIQRFRAACKGAKSYEFVLEKVREFGYKESFARVHWELISQGRNRWRNRNNQRRA